jgi:uncharacterized cysteine cluster protein YcgN (CxxCxxCC family)
MKNKKEFWKTKGMDEMSSSEWESLCDGCARCCMHKIEFEDIQELHYTAVTCRYLDTDKCQCTQYKKRHELVPDCVKVSPEMLREDCSWLPKSCAYRRLAEGRNLPKWHPLRTGRKESVHEAGKSVRGKTISENDVPDEALHEYIIHWVKT